MQTAAEVWILLEDSSPWFFGISAYLMNTTLTSLCSRLHFQRSLYGKRPLKMLYPSREKGKLTYSLENKCNEWGC